MKLQHKPIVRVKPEWALKVLKHYRSQWTEIEKIVHKMMFELLFHPFSDFHYHAPLQSTSSSRDALPVKEGLLVMAAGERGFWNAFCFQQTEEDKIQQSTFPMSRYFREGRANIFVPFYNGTKTSCYLLFSCWQTWNLPNSQTFLFLEKKDAEEGRFTEGCLTLLTLLILLTYAFGNVSISRPGDQVG